MTHRMRILVATAFLWLCCKTMTTDIEAFLRRRGDAP